MHFSSVIDETLCQFVELNFFFKLISIVSLVQSAPAICKTTQIVACIIQLLKFAIAKKIGYLTTFNLFNSINKIVHG